MKKLYLFLISVLLINILLIGLVSALEFDNSKDYEKIGKYGKVTITNAFGFGDKLMEITLTENSEFCLTTCYAKGTTKLYEDSKLFDYIDFMKGEDKQNLDYEIYIKDNGEWKKINNEVYKAGTYEWMLIGEKEITDTIDWIPTFLGTEPVTEWALWSSGQIEHYYKFDETSGKNASDSVGNLNFTTNATWTTDGIINGGYELPGSLLSSQATSAVNLSGYGNLSINFWINRNDSWSDSLSLLYTDEGCGAAQSVDIATTGSGKLVFCIKNATTQGKVTLAEVIPDNSVFQMLTMVYNGTNIKVYRNATLEADIKSMDTVSFDATKNITLFGKATRIIENATFDEFGIWNHSLSEDEIEILYNSGSGTSFETGISIILNAPANNTEHYILNNITFNINSLTNNTNLINVSLFIDGVYNSEKNITGDFNQTVISRNLSSFSDGSHEWTAFVCDNVECEWAAENRTFSLTPIQVNTITFNSTAFETDFEMFITNISNDDSQSITASLIYNGVSYPATKTGDDSEAIFTREIDIPSTTTVLNRGFYWEVTRNAVLYNSTENNQSTTPIVFDIVNSTLTPFINFTFVNEDNLSRINDIILPLSNWDYWLGSGTIKKNLTFSNNTANPNYAFGLSVNKTLNIDYSLQYRDAGGFFPQRTFQEVTTISNVTTDKTLYLLDNSDGIFVTFQVVNSADQVLSGVNIVASRIISGSTVIVGEGDTGSDGTITFWLNPDFVHTFTFAKDGFTTLESSFAPTQTSYTITLSGGDVVNQNYFQGIDYTILPTGNLVNDTTYSFEFNLTSSFWDVDSFGFTLRLANGSIAGSDSSTTTGNPATFSFDVHNLSIIYMDYSWIIDGNYTNATRYWTIYNTANTQWSINNFFTDFNAYINSGLFGLDDFGKSLIIFFILFISVGIISFKYGLVSPLAVSTLVFSIIFFFDVIVDMIPAIRGINNLLTYISALILLLVIFREVQK